MNHYNTSLQYINNLMVIMSIIATVSTFVYNGGQCQTLFQYQVSHCTQNRCLTMNMTKVRSALKNMILNRKINDKPIERDKLAEALLFDV